jgi:hypothetical protein
MKKILIPLLFVATLLIGMSGFAQNERTTKEWFNDISVSYSAGSIFYFTGNINHPDYPSEFYDDDSDPHGFGAFALSYHRKMNNVIALGFNFSYVNLWHDADDYSSMSTSQTYYDNLLNMLASVRFMYVNKPTFTMYSGICFGMTMDFGKTTFLGKDYTDRKLYPGGQLTLMGIRVGRAFGGFAEFGIGTLGIATAGLSYRLGD